MFELTGTLNYIVPCMISLMTAKFVGDAFGKGGIYPFFTYIYKNSIFFFFL